MFADGILLFQLVHDVQQEIGDRIAAPITDGVGHSEKGDDDGDCRERHTLKFIP